MRRATLDTLAWGAVGALGFLVLAQAYSAFADEGVGFLALLGVAVVVFAASSLVAHLAATRLR
ncbi:MULTISPECIES: hypothetical protein [Halobacterium]|uniref:hypothetical protein n=1 Tax=Halobacterium TaxID=2239 RepID=UPI00073EFCA7|nr:MULTISPECIES: hypothetical protein [Halobacterium]MCG1004186.1 hypothetical protein [Halobacterium noricense]